MAKKQNDTVAGIVLKVIARQTARGSIAHHYAIKNSEFILFSDQEVSLVQVGDHVRFKYDKKYLRSGSRRAYLRIDPSSLEIINPAEQTAESDGFIYVLSNKSMRGLLKIGFTEDSPGNRASQLSANTAVPTPFLVEWSLAIRGSPRLVEQRVHAALSKKRHGKEFFATTVEHAKNAVMEAYFSLYPEYAEKVSNAEKIVTERKLSLPARIEDAKKQAQEAARIQEYRRTPEFSWKTSGYVTVTERDFAERPNSYARPGLFNRMFGATPSWLSIRIEGRRGVFQGGGRAFRLSIEGWHKGEWLRDDATYYTLRDARAAAERCVHNLEATNYRLQLNIATELLFNPEIPEGYKVSPDGHLQVPSLSCFRLLEDAGPVSGQEPDT